MKESMTVEVVTEDKNTFVVIKCKVPKKLAPSKSGKSLLMASSEGNLNTGLKYLGEDVIVGLNVYTKVGGK